MAPRSRILTASGERLFRQARSCRPPVFIAKHHSTKWRQFDWVRQGTRPLIGSFGAVRLKGEIAVDGVQALNQADPANDSRRPIAGAHDRQLSGGPIQLQTEAVRGIRQRAQCRPAKVICRMSAMKGVPVIQFLIGQPLCAIVGLTILLQSTIKKGNIQGGTPCSTALLQSPARF